jgi:hypothetical protein
MHFLLARKSVALSSTFSLSTVVVHLFYSALLTVCIFFSPPTLKAADPVGADTCALLLCYKIAFMLVINELIRIFFPVPPCL